MQEDIRQTLFVNAKEDMQKYRLVLRHLWNSFLWTEPDFRDWDTVAHFDSIRSTLFDLVAGAVLRRRLELDHESQISILVVPALVDRDFERGAPIRISETFASQTSRNWDEPPMYATRSDMTLRFLDFFDWRVCDYRDLQYYLVQIVESRSYPHLVGREALIDVGDADVLALPTGFEPDSLRLAYESLGPGV